MDEKKLTEKVKRKNRRAFETAVREYTPYVSAVALRTLSGRACQEDIEEIAADVFLSLWNSAETLDPAEGLRAWLGTAARNRTIDWLRRQHPCEPLPEDVLDRREGPEELAERRELSARLWAAVDAMQEPDRTLFVRYYYEGEKLKTVAQDLGLKQSAAKQRLFRGRKFLKDRLSDMKEVEY